MTFEVCQGDCVELMRAMPAGSVDAICTDPPYGLEFMGKEWDAFRQDTPTSSRHRGERAGGHGRLKGGSYADGGSKAKVSYGGGGKRPSTQRCVECGKRDQFNQPHEPCGTGTWERVPLDPHSAPPSMLAFQQWCNGWATEALRVLKPGGHLLAFGGTRTYHRLACAVEDAGFEIRDTIAYMYGSGFPKSLNLDRLRGEAFCGCEAVPEHDLSRLRGGDVPAAVPAEGGQGALLHEGVSQPGAPADRSDAEAAPSASGARQPGMEGRGDLPAPEGQLRPGALRPSAGVGAADGPQGRVRDGTSAGDGVDRGLPADEDGVRPPSGPRSAEQSADELGALAGQPQPQDGGGRPRCERCGLPIVPRGLGTALKPAHEPVVVARKPLSGTVAATVLEHGCGALNIDGTRVGSEERTNEAGALGANGIYGTMERNDSETTAAGRWPANVVLSHMEECVPVGTRKVKGSRIDKPYEGDAGPGYKRDFPTAERGPRGIGDADGTETVAAYRCHPDCAVRLLDEQTGELTSGRLDRASITAENKTYGARPKHLEGVYEQDAGGASRFFYVAKASRGERNAGLEGFEEDLPLGPNGSPNAVGATRGSLSQPRANVHPTVKPISLMRWLVRLVTPPGGTVLDPFTGSGSTGAAAVLEGFDFIGLEREAEYVAIAEARIAWWHKHRGDGEAAEILAAGELRDEVEATGQLGMFD